MYFGNVTIKELENKLGITFSADEFKRLEELRTDIADGEKGKFHIFKDPALTIVTCETIADEVISIIKHYYDEGKTNELLSFVY